GIVAVRAVDAHSTSGSRSARTTAPVSSLALTEPPVGARPEQPLLCRASRSQSLRDPLVELLGEDREALDLREALGADDDLSPDELHELPGVRLRHQDALVRPHDVARVAREGVEVAKMGACDPAAAPANAARRSGDRAVGGTPAEDEEVGVVAVF